MGKPHPQICSHSHLYANNCTCLLALILTMSRKSSQLRADDSSVSDWESSMKAPFSVSATQNLIILVFRENSVWYKFSPTSQCLVHTLQSSSFSTIPHVLQFVKLPFNIPEP